MAPHAIRRAAALFCCVWVSALAPVFPAGAAEWQPGEKITLVTHAGPGAGVDVYLRQLAEIWARHQIVTKQVAVENITGARGDRARRHVVQQNRGNPHMLVGFTPQMVNSPILTKSDINVRSFTPVAMMLVEPMALFVHADTPYKSLKDLIEAARQKPKSVLQGGGAFGGPPSLMGKMMAEEAKVEFSYTPFKSSAESVVALLGKHVHFIMEQPSEANQHVKAGKLRPLAASAPLALYPELPTFASLGYRFRILAQFRGVMAPPGIAPEVAGYYIKALDRVRKTEEWKTYVKNNELVEHWIVGQELGAFLLDEENVYRRLNKELGLVK